MDSNIEIKLLKERIAYLEKIVSQNKNEIDLSLFTQQSPHKLLEMTLKKAMKYTNADLGIFYLVSKDKKKLEFNIAKMSSLDVNNKIVWPNLLLYDENGNKHCKNIATHCALNAKTINIKDIYKVDNFHLNDFKKFDTKNSYTTRSVLVIPMQNYEKEVIGVCQLINAIKPSSNENIPFSKESERFVLSLIFEASVAMCNVRSVNDLKELFECFIQTIATSIDKKSPYTGGHVRKVTAFAMLVANEINSVNHGYFKDKFYSPDELNELRIAALMHDIGKIIIPDHIMDKSTKLEIVYDRINIIKTRFEILKRDKQIAFLQSSMSVESLNIYEKEIIDINDDLAFLIRSNMGAEVMSDDDINRIYEISTQTFTYENETLPILSEDEVYNLTIAKGTLTEEEREHIMHHATVSVDILESLPFPNYLSKVPLIAGGHHEKLSGKGYPKGLKASKLSLEARIIAIADIFEALTSSNRPYKKPKKLSQVMKIIETLVKNKDLDPQLIKFIYEQKLHIRFAKAELKPEQKDI